MMVKCWFGAMLSNIRLQNVKDKLLMSEENNQCIAKH